MQLPRRAQSVPASIEQPSLPVLLAAIGLSLTIAQRLRDRLQALPPAQRQAAEKLLSTLRL